MVTPAELEAAPRNGHARQLPPGWSAVVHAAKSGAYKRYVGPGGLQAATFKAAWRDSGFDRPPRATGQPSE